MERYFCQKYRVSNITVTGLFFGARVTVSKFFVERRGKYKLQKSIENEIVISIIKYSVAILTKNLYGTHCIKFINILTFKRHRFFSLSYL